MHSPRFAAALLVGALVAACSSGSGNGQIGSNPVASVSISPSSAALVLGGASQLTATARDATGRAVLGVSIAWRAGDTTVATVSSTGLVVAVGVGSTPVTASVGRIEGSMTVRVDAMASPIVTSVTIDPVAAIVAEGGSTQFSATARDADGHVVIGRGEQWSGGDASIAFVEPLGRVTGLRPGSTTVTVRIDGQSATGAIRVDADYGFSLVYGASVSLGAPELFTLHINDPAAVALPVFAPPRPASDATSSPDGTALAFVVVSGNDTHIYRADRNGSNARPLTAGVGLRDQPAWSPDGTRIAFRERMTGLGTDIWLMDAHDGANRVNLTSDLGATSQSSPAWSWSPIGGSYRLAFSHSENGLGHIWTMRSDGSDKRQLTSSAMAYDDHPAWSPDGSRIVFERSSTGILGDLYWVDASTGGAGAALMPLIGPLAGPQFAPAWSPDGQLVAFTSRHASNEYQVYTVWADGTRLAQRTFTDQQHTDPAWIIDQP